MTSIKKTRQYTQSDPINKSHDRHIYIIGENHNYGADTIDLVKQIIKKTEYSTTRPILFTEYGFFKDNYFDLSEVKIIKDSRELGFIGLLLLISNLLCDINAHNFEFNKRLNKLLNTVYSLIKELKLTYKVNLDTFIKLLDLLPTNEIELDVKKNIVKKINMHSIKAIEAVLNSKKYKTIKILFKDYIKESLDHVDNCNQSYTPISHDETFTKLRDYELFTKLQSFNNKLSVNIPFIVVVGKAHLENWIEFLEDYNFENIYMMEIQ